MATYAIGDVQGCYDELRRLLDHIAFDPNTDTLWFTGDLVNRGPASLATLRFVRGLGERAVTVLGNHDLHLLAISERVDDHEGDGDSLRDVLGAADRDELLHWLRHRPLLHHDPALNFTLIHAGLPPQWDLAMAHSCAQEVRSVLQGSSYRDFLVHMYGNQPECWSAELEGWERWRFITNCFTRLRFCSADGRLLLDAKGPPGSQPPPYMPWFEVPTRASKGLRIVFGHWSRLGLRLGGGVYGLDTGCLWGGALTALRLDGEPQPFSIDCAGSRPPRGA